MFTVCIGIGIPGLQAGFVICPDKGWPGIQQQVNNELYQAIAEQQ